MKLQISSYLEKEMLLFLAGGASKTLLTYVIFSYLITFVIGIVYSYVFNATIMFRALLSWGSFLAYPTVYIVQLCFLLIGMEILVHVLHSSPTFAPLLNPALIVLITFVLSSRILANAPGNRDSRDDEMRGDVLE